MTIEFVLHAENRSDAKGFSKHFNSIEDAEFAVRQLEGLNASLSYSSKFFGHVIKWEGYTLDDGSKVTVDAIPVIIF